MNTNQLFLRNSITSYYPFIITSFLLDNKDKIPSLKTALATFFSNYKNTQIVNEEIKKKSFLLPAESVIYCPDNPSSFVDFDASSYQFKDRPQKIISKESCSIYFLPSLSIEGGGRTANNNFKLYKYLISNPTILKLNNNEIIQKYKQHKSKLIQTGGIQVSNMITPKIAAAASTTLSTSQPATQEPATQELATQEPATQELVPAAIPETQIPVLSQSVTQEPVPATISEPQMPVLSQSATQEPVPAQSTVQETMPQPTIEQEPTVRPTSTTLLNPSIIAAAAETTLKSPQLKVTTASSPSLKIFLD